MLRIFCPAVLASGLFASSALADDDHERTECDPLNITVNLSQSDPTPYNIAASICGHHGRHLPVIQVLLHGSTYSHLYWDFPGQPETYVQAANHAGFVTLNMDRIGIGQSDHPNAFAVTVESNAFTIHQIVTALRNGTLMPDGQPLFVDRVVLVGHSLGSDIAAVEAATYADVDGVIASGFLHNAGPGIVLFENSFYPAFLDPETSTAPPNYFTTIPGLRAPNFYNVADADPQVIAEDEETKQTVTLGELSTFVDGFAATPNIHVPVLVTAGDNDVIFCDAPSCTAGGTLVREAAFYAPDAELETFALPNSGHSMNLHLNAPVWFDVANDWVRRHMGDDD
jgi:pimeloyl-ACP methyl ester carboxylesterase